MDIHIITDTHVQSRYSHFELAEMAYLAGIGHVQYRHKGFDPARDLGELKAIAQLAARMGRVLIVNDNAALALEVGAQGVHLGKDDGSPLEARRMLGPKATIGATVHSLSELENVKDMPIDYIGVGPVFGTNSKDTHLPDLGLESLRAICAASPFPVVAIGSIRVENLSLVAEAGASGAAVLSAFCTAAEPIAYATQLRAPIA